MKETKNQIFKRQLGNDYICKSIAFKLAGIYIHIPFCRQACHYCDFHFSTNLERMDEMIQAILTELNLRSEYLQGEVIQTVYFGGGTPSLLTPKMINQILEKIHTTFSCEIKEVTLEANPDDLTDINLVGWKNSGIDRLSLGIQSFNEEILKFYNRAHTAVESQKAIEKARKVGFDKFSLDLIYGFPYSDHSLWEADLSQAIAQNPGHISSYSLTIEPKTTLENWTRKGIFKPAEEDFIAIQFEILQEMAEKAGYIQYEVASFGKPDQFALHNTNYWRGIPYLGIGPSAHSFDGKNRGLNPSSNTKYLKDIQSGKLPFIVENLTGTDLLNEHILTGLRTMWGVDLQNIFDQHGVDLLSLKKDILVKMDREGWLLWQDKNLSLSKTGKLLADSIAAALFV